MSQICYIYSKNYLFICCHSLSLVTRLILHWPPKNSMTWIFKPSAVNVRPRPCFREFSVVSCKYRVLRSKVTTRWSVHCSLDAALVNILSRSSRHARSPGLESSVRCTRNECLRCWDQEVTTELSTGASLAVRCRLPPQHVISQHFYLGQNFPQTNLPHYYWLTFRAPHFTDAPPILQKTLKL